MSIDLRVQEEAELQRRFRDQGIQVESLYDLDHRDELGEEVLDVLERSIRDFSSFSLKESLVFYLAKETKCPDLYLEELERAAGTCSPGSDCESYAWTLAERLRTSASANHYEKIVSLVQDKRLGVGRQMLVYALLRDKNRRAETVQLLTRMIADQDVTVQILDALGRLKAEEAIPVLERFADSSDSNHRREARKALRKLGRVQQPKTTGFRVRDGEALVEISGNFDAESVASLLETTALLTHDQLQQLEETLDSMDVEEETELEFVVPTAEGEARLSIGIFLADVDAPDVRFRSAPHVIAKLEREMGD